MLGPSVHRCSQCGSAVSADRGAVKKSQVAAVADLSRGLQGRRCSSRKVLKVGTDQLRIRQMAKLATASRMFESKRK